LPANLLGKGDTSARRKSPPRSFEAQDTHVPALVRHCGDERLRPIRERKTFYRFAANRHPLAKKEDEDSIRQILGSCSGIAQGVAALRNQFGDAHGRLGQGAERRLAHLTANSVG